MRPDCPTYPSASGGPSSTRASHVELNKANGNRSRIRYSSHPIKHKTEAMTESVDTDRSKPEDDKVSFGFENVSPDENPESRGRFQASLAVTTS